MCYFESSFIVRAPLARVWDFHSDPIGLARITPFPIRVVLRHVDRPVTVGSRIDMVWWFGLLPLPWRIIVREHLPKQYFVDEQPSRAAGPFARWVHSHIFEEIDDGAATRIIDRIEYEFPFGALGLVPVG